MSLSLGTRSSGGALIFVRFNTVASVFLDPLGEDIDILHVSSIAIASISTSDF